MIRVLHPGLFTTVQDSGRWGYQRFGIPVAGPMDPVSHRMANLLVGNRPSCATLEVTLAGPRLEFESDLLLAVCGAEFELLLDGEPVPGDTVLAARKGQRLAFGRRRQGARAYIAAAGGFDVPRVLGSRATHVGSGMGGVGGRALAAG
ncbi:MAG: allophanate hydrolase, partial [Acidobacteria bacterium]|nr:allophanate hydrolase [Acidobacteriota bacterium]